MTNREYSQIEKFKLDCEKRGIKQPPDRPANTVEKRGNYIRRENHGHPKYKNKKTNKIPNRSQKRKHELPVLRKLRSVEEKIDFLAKISAFYEAEDLM